MHNNKINTLSKNLLQKLIGNKKTVKNRVFIMMVGYSLSGKTTFARKLAKNYPFLIIESRQIHQLINKRFKELQDDDTVSGTGYNLRQELTTKIRQNLLTKLLPQGWPIIADSCHLEFKKRKIILDLARKNHYFTIIIWLKTPEKILLSRLKLADQKRIMQKQKPAWVDLYQKLQKKKFDPPKENEANVIIKI